MFAAKILVVDDDLSFSNLLSLSLKNEGYDVKVLEFGSRTSAVAEGWKPDIVLVDFNLPDIDGFQICKQLKAQKSTENIPIIMITGRSAETDIVAALELGAEDFLSKPFSIKVLIAKIRGSLRRKITRLSADSNIPNQKMLSGDGVSGIRIDQDRFSAFVEDQEIRLTPTELKLLECFMSFPGHAVCREKIVKYLRDQHFSISVDSVDVHIAKLRKKLGTEAGSRIETLRGVGYRIS